MKKAYQCACDALLVANVLQLSDTRARVHFRRTMTRAQRFATPESKEGTINNDTFNLGKTESLLKMDRELAFFCDLLQ